MEAKLCFIGHALMENRSGLIVDARLTRVSGHAERMAALDMIEGFADRPRAVTLGADKGYDADDFVEELRTMNVRPHVAQNTSGRRSAIDGRTTRHAGYADEPAHPQADRGGVRLDQDGGRLAQDQVARSAQGRLGLHLRRGRLQPRPSAEAPGRRHDPAHRSLQPGPAGGGGSSRWSCGTTTLDLVEPAYIIFDGKARRIRLRLCHRLARGGIHASGAEFNWDGNDEMDEACGDGWAELHDDGSLTGEISFHSGDEIAYRPRLVSSSTAC